MDLGNLKHRLPEPVRNRLRDAVRGTRLRRDRHIRQTRRRDLHEALATIRARAPELPNRADLEQLVWAWSNNASGDVDYLLAAAQHARDAQGPILECGSGLSTLLLAIYATQPVVTLENHKEWAEQVSAELTFAKSQVTLRHVPLREFDRFSWYDVAPDSLPEAFALVVCDGPPLAGVPGGRVGLLAVLDDHLPAGTIFLLDKHMQSAEREAITTWEREYGLTEIPDDTPILTLRRHS